MRTSTLRPTTQKPLSFLSLAPQSTKYVSPRILSGLVSRLKTFLPRQKAHFSADSNLLFDLSLSVEGLDHFLTQTERSYNLTEPIQLSPERYTLRGIARYVAEHTQQAA